MQVVNTPRDYIQALVCGYPKALRERTLLCMLRAFADESDAGSKTKGVLTVSGYVGFCVKWEQFSEEWNTAVCSNDAFSRVGYFKAIALKSAKWRKEHNVTKGDVNQVHQKLIPIIQKWYQSYSVVATVSCEDHAKIIVPSRFGNDPWLAHPYYFAYHVFVSTALYHAVSEIGILGDRMDFVFDRNEPITDRANEMFRHIRNSPDLDPKYSDMMGDAIPGDDTKLPPLQAADVLASRAKDHCREPHNRKISRNLLAISGSGNENVTWHLRHKNLLEFTEWLLERGMERDTA